MLLCIDIGNSTTGIGLYSAARTSVFVSSVPTPPHATRDAWAADLAGVFALYHADWSAVDGAIVSSVVPPLEESMLGAVELLTGCRPMVVGPGIKTGLNIRSDLHSQLGGDIVACCVAARERYVSPIIVIDLGTATTFSLLRGNSYEGCAIAPGVHLGLEALSRAAAELPRICLEPPLSPLGSNTVGAMRAGAVYGGASLVDGMIERFEDAFGTPAATVVATGGCAPLVLPQCKHQVLHNPTLLLDGLDFLYRKNSGKHH